VQSCLFQGCTTCFDELGSVVELKIFIYLLNIIINMKPVKTEADVQSAAKNAVEALYGKVEGFRIRTLLPFPTEHKAEAWDAQVVFMSKGMQYTVDLLINRDDGQVTNARLIDQMAPL